MTEYITEWVSHSIEDPFVREEIVRCRDCRYFRVGTNTDCCAFTERYAHPDGFCSWGEKRDDAE